MAKKYTVETLRDYLETKMIDRLVAIDDEIADEFEISCWDACLEGADWNATLNAMVDMYVKAIVSDRDWDGKERKYNVAVDITSVLERKAVEREIEQLKMKLEELE
jgi:3-keto-L-gulonate-6-phosphate decarboxylase